MISKVFSMKGNKSKTIEEIVEQLNKIFTNDPYTTKVGTSCQRNLDNQKVTMIVFEKEYFRIRGYVTLTILFTETLNEQRVDFICSGGATTNFNLGAFSNLSKLVIEMLEQNGFVAE